MKKNKFIFRILILLFVTGMALLNACEPEEVYPRTRLFSPVLLEDLFTENNTIIVNMGKMKEAISYTIEVSRDTFKTAPEYTVTVDTNYVIIDKELIGEDLLWATYYQVRATAHANETEFDSKTSYLGSVKTQKFPSNMGTPTTFDVLDSQARIFWTTTGAPITTIVVYAGTDVRLTTPLLTFNVTDDQRTDAEAIIYGLTASTTYQIAIYSTDDVRGWEVYTTRPPLVSGDNVINLAGYKRTLADTLADIASGSIVLLEGGRTYQTGGYKFDKSITFMSGYSFVQALPKIDCTTNFHVLGGSNVDSIVFKEVAFSGAIGSHYVFNPNEATAVTVGLLKFESCQIRELRGIIRFRGPAPGAINNYQIINCVVDSIGGYGLFTMDTNGGIAVNNVLLKNSTFSKCDYFMQTYTQSNSVIIEDCTLSEVPSSGAIMFRWRGTTVGTCDITNGLTMTNVIWGHAWDKAASGVYTFNADGGTPSLDATTVTVTNCYSTSQFAFVLGRELPGYPVGNYSGTDVALWVAPATVDFHFLDTGFSGKNSAGDPRWRPGK